MNALHIVVMLIKVFFKIIFIMKHHRIYQVRFFGAACCVRRQEQEKDEKQINKWNKQEIRRVLCE